ncbi:MAG: hypothetical protein ACI90V_000387 [Bacillariaceae sp.]|jgi:hypothetical protein
MLLCCVFNKVAADLFFFFLRRLFVLSNQFLERRLFRAKIVVRAPNKMHWRRDLQLLVEAQITMSITLSASYQ